MLIWVELYIYKSSAQFFFELRGPICGNCDLHQWKKSGNPFRGTTRRRRASRISTFLVILIAFLNLLVYHPIISRIGDPFRTFPGVSFTSYLSVIFGSKQASVVLSLSTANTEWTKARESRIQDTRIRREQITAVICKSCIEILDSVEDLLANDRSQTRFLRTEIDKPPAATN
ncbi:hypothetical protein G5I_04640 [Acromyrmex echinatior]|uniref:Uncharacterized protein n=1 Tax=Acromyrmex echinatior TaxID=103372 RepID=F4WG67_ACREC|nr:hypothetical protein G5I_04640 [Acromyrmex echinatior]